MTIHSILMADLPLGKVDKHSLSQQTLMELLVENIENKEAICGSTESPKPISEWTGVLLNDANEVVEIEWEFKHLTGSIDFRWLPLTTRKVFLSLNDLSGTIDFTCFPDSLEDLWLAGNQFGGSIDLTALPPSMKRLYLAENNFAGKTDFTQLPKSLEDLYVSETSLEGEIADFTGNLGIAGSYVKDMRNTSES